MKKSPTVNGTVDFGAHLHESRSHTHYIEDKMSLHRQTLHLFHLCPCQSENATTVSNSPL